MERAGKILWALGVIMSNAFLFWMLDSCAHSMSKFYATDPKAFWESVLPVIWVASALLFTIVGIVMQHAGEKKP